MIAEHIVENPDAGIITKVQELSIPQNIAGFISTLKTHRATITPSTEEPNPQAQNSWAHVLSSAGLFSRQTGYTVATAVVSTAAYGLYQYAASTEPEILKYGADIDCTEYPAGNLALYNNERIACI
jgi:hypothetical protein